MTNFWIFVEIARFGNFANIFILHVPRANRKIVKMRAIDRLYASPTVFARSPPSNALNAELSPLCAPLSMQYMPHTVCMCISADNIPIFGKMPMFPFVAIEKFICFYIPENSTKPSVLYRFSSYSTIQGKIGDFLLQYKSRRRVTRCFRA